MTKTEKYVLFDHVYHAWLSSERSVGDYGHPHRMSAYLALRACLVELDLATEFKKWVRNTKGEDYFRRIVGA